MSLRLLRSCVALCLLSAASSPRAADTASAGCLALLPVQIVSTQTLAGKHVRTTAKLLVGRGQGESLKELQARLSAQARGSHLMRRRTGQWHVFSYWQENTVCIAQVRSRGDRIEAGFISRLTLELNSPPAARAVRSPESDLPAWWPRLKHTQVSHWRDSGFWVRTIVGFSQVSPPGLKSRFRKRALRAGYRIAGSASTRETSAAGSVLLLAQRNRELVLVFTPRGAMTGVVAHLKETIK